MSVVVISCSIPGFLLLGNWVSIILIKSNVVVTWSTDFPPHDTLVLLNEEQAKKEIQMLFPPVQQQIEIQ